MRPSALLLLVVPVVAACGGRAAAGAGPSADPRAPAAVRPFVPAADPLASLPADGAVVRYAGPFARDPVVLGFQRDAARVVEGLVARLRDETGLHFAEGRAPRIVLADAVDLPPEGATELRLVDGVRRTEIRVPAWALATGEFRPADHLAERIAEAGVLAASPERTPPEWVVEGLPPVFARTVERRVAAALTADGARGGSPSVGDLEPAFRLAALLRIGVGERVLPRFLLSRLSGASDAGALREVGVGSLDFLDAAAATEADRTVEFVGEDPRIDALRAVRAAVLRGDAGAADAALSRAETLPSGAGWVDAELRLARAEIALLREEATAAVATLDDVLARPNDLVRLRDAQFLRALAALRAGDASAASRAAAFARAHPLDARAAPILGDLGVAPRDAVELVAADAGIRARAASRIGQSGRASAAPFVAASLRDGDASVRRAAADALGALGAKAAGGDLEIATSDADPSVRAAALAALAAVDGERGVRRARELSGDADAAPRAAAATVLAAHAPKPPAAEPKPAASAPKTSTPPAPAATKAPAAAPSPRVDPPAPPPPAATKAPPRRDLPPPPSLRPQPDAPRRGETQPAPKPLPPAPKPLQPAPPQPAPLPPPKK